MPAESVIERLKRRITTEDPYPSEYIAVRVTEVKALLRVADAAEQHCTDHKILMPTGCVCRVCSAVRALRAGGPHD